jgi:hypothetical protein
LKIKYFLTLVAISMSLAACGAGSTSSTTPTLPPYQTATPGRAEATATAPAYSTTISATATSAPPPGTAEPTVAVPTTAPTTLATATPGPLPSGDLTNNQMATVLGDSLADYPWRMEFHSKSQSAGQAITGTITANSTSRLEVAIEEPVAGTPVTIDLIVITPTLYAKVNGIPSSLLQAAGLQEDQWGKVPTSQDVLGVSNIASAASNPSDLVLGLGFQDLLSPSPSDQTPFKLTGTEEVAGVETNVYTRQASGSIGNTTYKVYVGTANSRIYMMQAEGPISATVNMTYDSSINVQAPIP